jgi:hypothetical protein
MHRSLNITGELIQNRVLWFLSVCRARYGVMEMGSGTVAHQTELYTPVLAILLPATRSGDIPSEPRPIVGLTRFLTSVLLSPHVCYDNGFLFATASFCFVCSFHVKFSASLLISFFLPTS